MMFARKFNKIPQFYIIIAEKHFPDFFFFGGGGVSLPLPLPLPLVSYADAQHNYYGGCVDR